MAARTRHPVVLPLLRDIRNRAVEEAVVEALPALEAEVAREAIELILYRNQPDGLRGLVCHFATAGEEIRQLLLARVHDLYTGVRAAIGDANTDARLSAIEMIEQSGDGKLAYLLAAALRGQCPRTRSRAADALHALVVRIQQELEANAAKGQPGASLKAQQGLVEALRHAIRGWEIHLQPKVLLAGLVLCEPLESTILEKLEEPKSNFLHAVAHMLEGVVEPGLAGFCLRALAMPALRPTAVRALTKAQHVAFLQALGKETWLLADPEVRKGCLYVRGLGFLRDGIDRLLETGPEAGAGLVRLLGASGLRGDRKVSALRAIIMAGEEHLDHAAVWEIMRIKDAAATDLLSMLADRSTEDVRRIAARELQRRGAIEGVGRATIRTPAGEQPGGEDDISETLRTWAEYWNSFEFLSRDEQLAAVEELGRVGVDLFVPLRAKLTGANPLDRAKALRIVRCLALGEQMAELVHHLTSDPDPIVRSAAVALLADVPGVTTRRILRRAVDDTDERVQANAITAMEDLGIDERAELIAPKLESQHNRVRANAIKALLQLELRDAGDALIDMLDHASRAHRLSGLWVVERLELGATIRRVQRMAQRDPDQRVRQRARRVLRNLGLGEGDRVAVTDTEVPTATGKGGGIP